jgi:hypothetical protein
MAGVLQKFLRKRKYGPEVVVVSGLPRSGTSMMMKMLEAAGLPILTDAVRKADDDNPKGYFEYERVKDLEKETDKTWVREARGKVLKVISFLLKDLPPDNFYRVIFLRRDVDEVVASQNKMIRNRGEANRVEDEEARRLFQRHLLQVKMLVSRSPNFEMLEVDHRETIEHAKDVAQRVSAFLGGGLDVGKMAAAVDRSLYRNRKEDLAAAKPT